MFVWSSRSSLVALLGRVSRRSFACAHPLASVTGMSRARASSRAQEAAARSTPDDRPPSHVLAQAAAAPRPPCLDRPGTAAKPGSVHDWTLGGRVSSKLVRGLRRRHGLRARDTRALVVRPPIRSCLDETGAQGRVSLPLRSESLTGGQGPGALVIVHTHRPFTALVLDAVVVSTSRLPASPYKSRSPGLLQPAGLLQR